MSQTLALVGATLGAVVITFIGTSYQQHVQARRGARDAQNRAISELMSAAMDVLFGVRAFREAHETRTLPRYYLRLAGTMMRALPRVDTWRDVADVGTLKPVLGGLLDFDRERVEGSRTIVLDAATVVIPRLTRYFAVIALLTLGDDKQLADAVRDLTPKVMKLAESTGAKKPEFKKLDDDLQQALENFRDRVDERRARRRIWKLRRTKLSS